MAQRAPRLSLSGGYAIVLVLWGVGLASVLISSYVLSSRLRVAAGANIVFAFKAEMYADAAIGLTQMRLADAQYLTTAAWEGVPHFCSLDDNAVAAIVLEDEAGKLDVNATSIEFLEKSFLGLGFTSNEAIAAATSIILYRSGTPAFAGDALSVGRKGSLFRSILEIDQIEPLSAFHKTLLRSLGTAHSRLAEPDLQVAPPALYAALVGRGQADVASLLAHPYPNVLPQRPTRDKRMPVAATIHVETKTTSGSGFVREALMTTAENAPAGTYSIREWRRGKWRYEAELNSLIEQISSVGRC